jgi:trigger factor
VTNVKKQFIDNFEDQLIGMKKEETRQVYVTFPVDYRETTLAGKKAVFTVTLKAIKCKITPVYNDEFAKSKGFETIEIYEKDLKEKLIIEKEKNAKEATKKQVLTSVINNSKISPIPTAMIERETEKEWNSFLRRLGKTEEQLLKENKNMKVGFFDHSIAKSTETIKAFLVLEQVTKDFGILVTEDEIVDYTMRVSTALKFDSDRKNKIREDLKINTQQFEMMKTAALNEKTIEFLLNEVK